MLINQTSLRSHTVGIKSSPRASSPEDEGDDVAREETMVQEQSKRISEIDDRSAADPSKSAIASASKKATPAAPRQAPEAILEHGSVASTRSKRSTKTTNFLNPARERQSSPVHVSSDDDYTPSSPKSKRSKTTSRAGKPRAKSINAPADRDSVSISRILH